MDINDTCPWNPPLISINFTALRGPQSGSMLMQILEETGPHPRVYIILSSASNTFSHLSDGYALYWSQQEAHVPRHKLSLRFQFLCSSSNYLPVGLWMKYVPPHHPCNTREDSWRVAEIFLLLAPSTLWLWPLTNITTAEPQNYLPLEREDNTNWQPRDMFCLAHLILNFISCNVLKIQDFK